MALMKTLDIPTSGLADFVRTMARNHGVAYSRSSRSNLDDLADTITGLAGDEVTTDETEDLIVELKRVGVIDSGEMVEMLGRYLDEKATAYRFL